MEENQVIESEVVETPVEEAPQLTAVEQQALEQGWRPKDQWEGDPDKWRPAKEFVDRGELFAKIHDLSSENKQIKEALKGLLDHHKKVKESEYARAIESLRAQKKEALLEQDADKVIQIEEAIDIVKDEQAKEKATAPAPAAPAGPTPTFQTWLRSNPWYVSDPELRAFADDIGVGYYNRHGKNVSEQEVYDYVAKHVKQAYADKFKGQAPKTPVVEGGTPSRQTAKKVDTYQLTEEQERVMKNFVRMKLMTKEEYIAELKRIDGKS